MDNWDVALLVISGYIAVTALVRLMNSRRSQVMDRVRSQMAQGKQNPRAPVSKQVTEPQQGDQAA